MLPFVFLHSLSPLLTDFVSSAVGHSRLRPLCCEGVRFEGNHDFDGQLVRLPPVSPLHY
jgi:hypothetical protein